MRAQVEDLGAGRFAVRGELDLDSVTALWEETRRLFKQQPPSRIDLAGVHRTDSAGVALLVEWLRQAKAQHWELHFVNVPAQMLTIIRVADLDGLLPVG